MRVTWRMGNPQNNEHHQEANMAAYLISLALASLVAIAVWEAVS
jgi:hypothetical protein